MDDSSPTRLPRVSGRPIVGEQKSLARSGIMAVICKFYIMVGQKESGGEVLGAGQDFLLYRYCILASRKTELELVEGKLS
jgi:hypothetical protein